MTTIRAMAATLAFLSVAAQGQSGPDSATAIEPTGAQTRAALGEALEKGDRILVTAKSIALAEQGGSLSDASFERIRPFLNPSTIAQALAVDGKIERDEDSIERLHLRFARNADPLAHPGRPAPVASVPADFRLVEGIAWDAATQRLFVATVVDGKLAYRGRDERWNEVAIGTPRAGLFGMAIDAKRRLLWIATGSVEQVAIPQAERMTGLIAVDLDRLEVARRVPVPQGAAGSIGDLTLAADGTVFATDVLKGAVYRCAPGCAVLEAMLPEGSFANPQGLVLLDREHSLFIADYKSGLWRYDLAEQRLWPAAISGPAMLEGIDGLVRLDGNCLVAIQNGTRPRRIARLCRAKGTRAYLATSHTVFPAESGEATLGTLAGKASLWFVADSQWERYGAAGAITDGKPPRPTAIHSVTIR